MCADHPEKETEESLLSYYKQAIDHINEGVHVVDRHGRSVLYNRKMTELEAMEEGDVLGKSLESVFQFPGGQESTLLQAVRSGRPTLNVRQTYFNQKGKKITTLNNTYPITENGTLIGAIEIANDVTKMERLVRENLLRQQTGNGLYTFEGIIGRSEALLRVIQYAQRAARTASSVLVVGETGTGKELFVQGIHQASARSGGPFISQNCAALPEDLVEGLLFGTTKGAYTGAVERPGLFEQAENGTLFLDEINSLAMPLQAKLLRVLQERSFRRLGDTRERTMNVRILAAMNEHPDTAIDEGRLREDLYYRLGVVTLLLPTLRERREDIAPLVRHFIGKYNDLFQMQVEGISEEVEAFFLSHSWPGNVRELQHTIEGAMNLLIDETVIEMAHLPIRRMSRMTRMGGGQAAGVSAGAAPGGSGQRTEAAADPGVAGNGAAPGGPGGTGAAADSLAPGTLAGGSRGSGAEAPSPPPAFTAFPAELAPLVEAPGGLTLRAQLELFEAYAVRRAVENHGGNIVRAAKELGLSRQSLQYRLRKLKLR
ncbi:MULTISPECIES: sigma-54 interaction domain-containing protein [Paenibacillus]|uniref:sigma-54 interaction domain-containing protein n=1 Tax=Paenibacillus TaxID=44249 RepID=UPI0022B85919|nr:sigma 54-interacting transcriptional regulator [Paenibacillus caseinilyticus]MCZ8518454.1 sigma 54-interacting transcriptional regulator [Paenibacillus caseinilyticus]